MQEIEGNKWSKVYAWVILWFGLILVAFYLITKYYS